VQAQSLHQSWQRLGEVLVFADPKSISRHINATAELRRVRVHADDLATFVQP
jgi:hypothetical protein